jgi:hypothetical protein
MVLVAVALEPSHAHPIGVAPDRDWSEEPSTGAEGDRRQSLMTRSMLRVSRNRRSWLTTSSVPL